MAKPDSFRQYWRDCGEKWKRCRGTSKWSHFAPPILACHPPKLGTPIISLPCGLRRGLSCFKVLTGSSKCSNTWNRMIRSAIGTGLKDSSPPTNIGMLSWCRAKYAAPRVRSFPNTFQPCLRMEYNIMPSPQPISNTTPGDLNPLAHFADRRL